MAFDFSKFKKSSEDNLARLQGVIEEKKKGGRRGFDDDTFWRPTINDDGNGRALIRLLPSQDPDDLPWADYYIHNFKVGQKRYVMKCPTSVGRDCHVCSENSKLWDTKLPEDIAVARPRSRKRKIVINVLVLNDPGNKDNEGKVFKYRIGVKIWDKIQAKLEGDPDMGEPSVDVFNLWTGANFRMKIKTVGGWPNYDDCTFDAPTTLYDGDEEKLTKVMEAVHDIKEWTDPTTFPSAEEIKAKFEDVTGGVAGAAHSRNDARRSAKPKEDDVGIAPNALDDLEDVEKDVSDETPPFDLDEGEDAKKKDDKSSKDDDFDFEF